MSELAYSNKLEQLVTTYRFFLWKWYAHMERENLISGLGTYLWETHVGVSSLRVLPSPVDELCIIVHGIGMQDVGE